MLIIGAFFLVMSALQGGGRGVMQFGKSKAKQVTKDDTVVTFADVAGCDEAVEELQEIKDFLKDPGRFQAIGADPGRVSCSSGRPAPARRSWPGPWPGRRECRSSPSRARTS